ncbi:MAG: bph2 [Rickettsiales bacterium]|jgi:nucleoid DNA-binding protein|nr:bph2 [Rickettsiales bacterium]
MKKSSATKTKKKTVTKKPVTKKPAAKKKSAVKKPVAKKKSSKPVAAVISPVKETLTKSALLNLIAEKNNITRKQASEILATIEGVMLGSVHPRGVGEFILPGLLKVTLRKVPARKAGTLIRNPATGEMMKGKAKPASVRVKVRPLSKLRAAAIN